MEQDGFKNAVTSKAAYSIVLASLMLLVTGGSFLADQHTIGYIENTDMNNRNYDYVYFIGGGYMNRITSHTVIRHIMALLNVKLKSWLLSIISPLWQKE